MTAPARGSGTTPACTARVPKRRCRSRSNASLMSGTYRRLSRRASEFYVSAMTSRNGLSCLVVDDEPRLRQVLVHLLENEGFHCREAGSGVEALQVMERDPAPLVISDLRMPQMDGQSMLRELMRRWPNTAVVMVSAVAY